MTTVIVTGSRGTTRRIAAANQASEPSQATAFATPGSRENHPEDFAVLYEEETLPRQTDDEIALREQRVADYVEFKNSQP